MNWFTWTFLGVVASLVLGVGIYGILFLIREEAKWTKVDSPFLSYKFKPLLETDAVDAALLDEAMKHACIFLDTLGPYRDGYVYTALEGVKVIVHNADSFFSVSHQIVAGESYVDEHAVAVGPRFVALAHEFGHLVEFQKTHSIDYLHHAWGGNGFFAAQDAYEEWLSRRVSAR